VSKSTCVFLGMDASPIVSVHIALGIGPPSKCLELLTFHIVCLCLAEGVGALL
jgi:hypothetical protein